MNCLPCFSKDEDEVATDPQPPPPAQIDTAKEPSSSLKAHNFTFRELAMATKNFRQECLLGEGGFGRVFKGKLQSSGKVVAVKQLDRNGMQGNKEFLVEVLMLSLIQHTNLVSLIGYCADGDQRLLVYEYLEMGSLENHLFGDDPNKKPIDWFTRMKIASGAANGLEYLHDKANPPIIYRDLKPSNILLDENFEPKLSDFGLAKLGAGGGKVNPTSRVMGTYGYSAPEYSSGGELTLKSDIYSFGVVLLELLTGRKAIDTTRPNDEQNLVTWAQPIFREPKRFPDLADPRLNNEFPVTSLNQAVGICAMCLQEEPSVRPLIGDVVAALGFLAMPQPNISLASDLPPNTPPSEQKMHYENEGNQNQPRKSDKDSSRDDDRSSEHGGSSGSEVESNSDQRNEGSSQNFSAGEKDCSSRYSDGRHSFDNSEEQSAYTSDSDSGNINYDDAETAGLEDPDRSIDSSTNYSLYSARSTDSSLKSDAGNKSSKHGSSRGSSPTKNSDSRRRKPVVTFREPSLSAKKNGTRKPEGEKSSSDSSTQTILYATTDNGQPQHQQHQQQQQLLQQQQQQQLQQHQQQIQQQQQEQSSSSSSSSSSESSSESEDEEGSSRIEKVNKNSLLKDRNQEEGTSGTDSYATNHRVFEQPRKENPKLRHLKTR